MLWQAGARDDVVRHRLKKFDGAFLLQPDHDISGPVFFYPIRHDFDQDQRKNDKQ
jgi:hypothetical protein